MKKFWIVLLALGLVAGFAMSASAADVKFSGTYYVQGSYADNPSNLKDGATGRIGAIAVYNQRLRMQTEFKVAEGLVLVTRFDALEKDWGDQRWRGETIFGGRVETASRPNSGVAGSGENAQANIEFERAYVDFNTKIGKFMIGYQNFIAFGTVFLDTHGTRPGIKYIVPIGPLTIIAAIEKTLERSASSAGTFTDADANIYDLGVVYKFGAGDAGLMYQYSDSRGNRSTVAVTNPVANIMQAHALNPYVKMKFGPVYVEAEGIYGFGKAAKYEGAGAPADKDLEAFGAYVHAKADIGPAYVGGIFAWARGDDITTTGKVEGSVAQLLVAGQAWDPCLILFNDANSRANGAALPAGAISGMNTSAAGAALGGGSYYPYGVFFDNAWLYQIYGGFKPVKELDIMASLTWVYSDQNIVTNQVSKDIGWEVDLTAKYKIFDNLEYMIGGAYLFTGDFWKYNDPSRQVANNYLLIHKLTLSF
jgi:hypothetical protein